MDNTHKASNPTTRISYKNLLISLHEELNSWRKVHAEFNESFTPAYWCAVANGKRKLNSQARRILQSYFSIPSNRKPIISCRIAPEIYEQLNQLPKPRSQHIEKALQEYLSKKIK